jgi:hypothetical protein
MIIYLEDNGRNKQEIRVKQWNKPISEKDKGNISVFIHYLAHEPEYCLCLAFICVKKFQDTLEVPFILSPPYGKLPVHTSGWSHMLRPGLTFNSPMEGRGG